MALHKSFSLVGGRAACEHTTLQGDPVLYMKESRRGQPDIFQEYLVLPTGAVLVTRTVAGEPDKIVGQPKIFNNINDVWPLQLAATP